MVFHRTSTSATVKWDQLSNRRGLLRKLLFSKVIVFPNTFNTLASFQAISTCDDITVVSPLICDSELY